MIEETLKKDYECKHSVRFSNPDSKVCKSLYVMNEAVKELGDPVAINIKLSNVVFDGEVKK